MEGVNHSPCPFPADEGIEPATIRSPAYFSNLKATAAKATKLMFSYEDWTQHFETEVMVSAIL